MSCLVTLVGLGMAVAGADKLAGDRAYEKLYRHWGWTRGQMQLAGLAEFLGGELMAFGRTRRLGGALMTGASVTQLTAELAHGDGGLALARTGVLACGVTALLG